MSIFTAFSIAILAGGMSYCFYYLGWNTGFGIGKQRGWVNGYSAAKQSRDEVFDYEKN